MITIFTIPKPFKGHIKTIQTNAIRSWLKLRPSCQVILFGDEEGIAQVAEELGVQHVPDMERNEFGTPLLDYTFRTAHELAQHNILCYVNADIILMSDFVKAIQIVSREKREFLVVGRRWNVDIDEPLNFEQQDWEEYLRTYAMEYERENPYDIWMYAMDYFAFPKELFNDIPPFAVGRAGWDNWMVYQSRSLGLPVIDVGRFATVVHQNHDYSHVSMGQEEVYKGLEAQANIEMAGGRDHIFSLMHASHLLIQSGLPRIGIIFLGRAMMHCIRQWVWRHRRTVSRVQPGASQSRTLFGIPFWQYRQLIQVTAQYLRHKVSLGTQRHAVKLELIRQLGATYEELKQYVRN